MAQDKVRRRPRKLSRKHQIMAGKLITHPKSYLVESFVLNSVDRVVSRKGKGNRPDPECRRKDGQVPELVSIVKQSGRKVNSVDLHTLTTHFRNYVGVVNLLLERIYSNPNRVQQLGRKLSEYKGRAYTLLRKETDLNYERNDVFKERVYERLFRNALEQTGQILQADYTRRELFGAALSILDGSVDDVLVLLRRKRIPSPLIRRVRDACDAIRNNSAGYHYALGVLRQIRLVIDRHILNTLGIKIGWRSRQRVKVSALLRRGFPELQDTLNIVVPLLSGWAKDGYPFTLPHLKSYSLDFSASTENDTGQGYWFTLDSKRDHEVLLHLKLPPGIDGKRHEDSPYRSRTLTFRFLDWLPRAADGDSEKASTVLKEGVDYRAEQLTFRSAKFMDMHQQLMNTIEIQRITHQLSTLKQKKNSDSEQIIALTKRVQQLKEMRRSAPPRLLLRNGVVTLQIPFLNTNGEVSSQVLGEKMYQAKAGVDRGIRIPVVLSVAEGNEYKELLLGVEHLLKKRQLLRKQAYALQSVIDKKRGNWDHKRSGQPYPGHILKRGRHMAALWGKVRRLDREVARIVASRTVWFCEEHNVKTVFFEDLRNFQVTAGFRDLSYNLSSNLWGKIIDTVRYMRKSLGHSKYSVWTVNPKYTSQTCHICGKRGIRVEGKGSTTEKKGGEYFYCMRCNEYLHADVNAARNIMHVHQGPSAVAGRTA